MSLLFTFSWRNSSSGITCSASLSEFFLAYPWPARTNKKMEIPCADWERMRSLTSLIKHTKIFDLIGSLVFRIFLCVSYRNDLHQGTLKLRYFNYLKKYEPCRDNIFALIRILIYLCTGCASSELYFIIPQTGHHFPSWI